MLHLVDNNLRYHLRELVEIDKSTASAIVSNNIHAIQNYIKLCL